MNPRLNIGETSVSFCNLNFIVTSEGTLSISTCRRCIWSIDVVSILSGKATIIYSNKKMFNMRKSKTQWVAKMKMTAIAKDANMKRNHNGTNPKKPSWDTKECRRSGEYQNSVHTICVLSPKKKTNTWRARYGLKYTKRYKKTRSSLFHSSRIVYLIWYWYR